MQRSGSPACFRKVKVDTCGLLPSEAPLPSLSGVFVLNVVPCSSVLRFLGEQEEVFLYGEEISVDATEKEEEVSPCYPPPPPQAPQEGRIQHRKRAWHRHSSFSPLGEQFCQT